MTSEVENIDQKSTFTYKLMTSSNFQTPFLFFLEITHCTIILLRVTLPWNC